MQMIYLRAVFSNNFRLANEKLRLPAGRRFPPSAGCWRWSSSWSAGAESGALSFAADGLQLGLVDRFPSPTGLRGSWLVAPGGASSPSG